MAKEKIVGFRVSDELYNKLHEMATDRNTSISDVLREIILDNLDLSYRFSQWEIHAWDLFSVNADQLNYAKKASSPEQFFSIVSKWSKHTKIRILPHPEMVMIEFTRNGKNYLITESKILPKIQIIQSIIDQFNSKLEAEVLDEAERLYNGTIGGNVSSADEKQSYKPELSVQESASSKGHTDLS